MTEPSAPTPPSPQPVFDMVLAYQRTAAIKAAVALDLFSAIGGGAGTADELARRCQADPRGIRILADYLTVLEFLAKQDGRYLLTPVSQTFLDRRSPAYMGSIADFLASPTQLALFEELPAAARRGGTASDAGGNVSPDNPVWVDFARAMAPMAAVACERLADLVDRTGGRLASVLDIAAGHGLYGIAIGRRHPQATIHALDWPAVVAVGKENAEKAGIAARYRTIGGSAFDQDFGSGHDLVLLTNFLHHFEPSTCEGLLRKVHAALAPGGRAVALEFIPNPDRVSPPMAAKFALIMLATTPRGDAYTFAEYEAMFRAAGFGQAELHDLLPTEQRVIVARK